MEYATLNNGVRMPRVGYGVYQVSSEECERCVLDALEVGYRAIDTAQSYGNEAAVGSALQKSGLPRPEVFLTTKIWISNAGYEKARASIDKSLANLRTDYIDLLLIHEPYEEAPAMYRALEEACRAGKVRAVGVSNFNWDEYQRLAGACEMIPAVDQVESHVYFPRLELRQKLEARGTRMQSWAPFTEGRRDLFAEPVLQEIGAAHGKTAAQTALRYLIQNGIGVIPKSSHRARMEENFALFDFALTAAEMERIGRMNEGASLFGWY